MTVRMTKKLQQSLGIKNLPVTETNEGKSFLSEWYMNIFSIKKYWFFIIMETTTFYTVVKPAEAIGGSEKFIEYMQSVIKEIINKENTAYEITNFYINEMHLRNTENKPARRIIVDMVFHAEIMKYKNGDLSIFEKLNDIPQALKDYSTPREMIINRINDLIINKDNIISIN